MSPYTDAEQINTHKYSTIYFKVHTESNIGIGIPMGDYYGTNRAVISDMPAVRTQVAEAESGQAPGGLSEPQMQEPVLGSTEAGKESVKKCSKCGEIKSFEDFPKNKQTKDGLRYLCKSCVKAYNSSRHDSVMASSKKWRDKDRDNGHKHYWANRDRLLEESKKRNSFARLNNPQRKWARCTIYRHKHNGNIVTITVDELEKIAKSTIYCPICDCELDWVSIKTYGNCPSLDRKYNGNRISLQNSWIICHRCNSIKNTMPMPEFVLFCKKVVERFGKDMIRESGQ